MQFPSPDDPVYPSQCLFSHSLIKESKSWPTFTLTHLSKYNNGKNGYTFRMTSAAFTGTTSKKVSCFFTPIWENLEIGVSSKVHSQTDYTSLRTFDIAREHLGFPPPPPQLVTEQSLSNSHYRLSFFFFRSLDNFSDPSVSQDPRSPVRIHSGVEQIVITFFLSFSFQVFSAS